MDLKTLPNPLFATSLNRRLINTKSNTEKIIIETLINQANSELIGTFYLSKDGVYEFCPLELKEGHFVCVYPEWSTLHKQVGKLFN